MSGAVVASAKLNRTNLSDAELSDSTFASADLTNSNLINANLTNSILFYANLTNTNLTNADLSRTILFSANLSRANLTNTNLFQAKYATPEGLDKDSRIYLNTVFPEGFDPAHKKMFKVDKNSIDFKW